MLTLVVAATALTLHGSARTPLTSSAARHATPIASSIGRREFAVSVATLAAVSQQPPNSWAADDIKTVVVAGATGQTGRRCLQQLTAMNGVSAVGGVRDITKAAKKLSESKIEIRGAMIEKGAAIDASSVELKALDVEKSSVDDMSTTLKGADSLIIAVGFVPGNPFKMDAAVRRSHLTCLP